MGHIDERAVQEAPFRQSLDVAGEARFVLRAAVEIFEHEARQTAMRHRPQIFNRRGAARVAPVVKPAGRRPGRYRRRGPGQVLVGRCKTRRGPAAEAPRTMPAGQRQRAEPQRRER